MLTTPPRAEPQDEEPGPLMISMLIDVLHRDDADIDELACRLKIEGDAVQHEQDMSDIGALDRKILKVPSPPRSEAWMPDTLARTSTRVWAPIISISAAVMTVMFSAVWERGLGLRVAETTRSFPS